MKQKVYNVMKVETPIELNSTKLWKNIPEILIDNYIWMENNYKPKLVAKLCYSKENLLVYFRSYEKEVTARFTNINDSVHKDSCVELFVNLFPNQSKEYINFEVNSIGTMHVGFGAPGNRKNLNVEEIRNIEVISNFDNPVIGLHGSNSWEIFYKVPFSMFEKQYKTKFTGEPATANLYKCGDETKFEHYATWNLIDTEKPNFHLPEYFGNIIFEK